MADHNYFLGIDLGTTNSVIAYANPQANTEKLKPMVLDVPRLSDTGGSRSEKTLPSVVYYRHDKNGEFEPIVGDFAKAQYGKRYGFVIKSVKSSMGDAEIPDINQDVPDQNPADVSAKILQQLLAGAKRKLMLQELPKDVVITIPASFDGDQCKATLDAASRAGISAYDSAGNPKDILLYEPKAVLYDIINSQMNGEIPESIMDVSTPKNILVYDLGGGTLDVSLYKVSQNKKGELLNIEDMAISRYTRLGGDNFDNLIAEKLCDEFIDMVDGAFVVTKQIRKEIMSVLIKNAERLKIDMNNAYEMMANRNEILPDDHTEYTSELNLYNGYPFERDLSKEEMMNFIRPLLGEQLTMDSVKNIERIKNEKDINNIIYPILDVLAKARARYGGEVPVDYVVLNGGMSKFFPVIERVKKFFGKDPITLNDPDMSVAKGAAIYHYYLHKYNIAAHIESVNIEETLTASSSVDSDKTAENLGEKPKTIAPGTLIVPKEHMINRRILNDTLNLEVRGGLMRPIATAGTSLPFTSENIDDLVLPKNGDCIRLPLYYGSGHRAELPNRKIAERILTFPQVYAADTPISIQVSINQLNIISIRTWVTGKNEELGSVTMAVGDISRKGILVKGAVQKGKKKPVLANSTAGMNVDFRSECNHLYDLCQRQNKAQKNRNQRQVSSIAKNVSEVVKRMKAARNGAQAGAEINEAMDKFHQNLKFLSNILGIGGQLAPLWNEDEQQIFRKKCVRILDMVLTNAPYYSIRDYHMQAITALAKINDPDDIPMMEKLLMLDDKSFPLCAAIALGKMQADPTKLISESLKLTTMDIQRLTNYFWAIGRLCSREVGIYNDMQQLTAITEKCISLLSTMQLRNTSAINILVYALGELCDTRSVVDNILPNELNRKAKAVLEKIKDRIMYTEMEQQCFNKISMAMSMIDGEILTEVEGAQLLELRKGK